MTNLRAPFPYFGGKRTAVEMVWERLGRPTQYIEPFCGSAAMLLGAPKAASLEVVNDLNGFIANFWRTVKHQPDQAARWADYPVSHIDLGARHRWLMEQRERIGAELHDPDWPGDPKVAGWWLWGQCCWIGSGWCDWTGKVPHAGNAGRGIQAAGQVPHAGNAGMGIQAAGQVPETGRPKGLILGIGEAERTRSVGEGLLTSGGRSAWVWLHKLADRLERVRVTHGAWNRCLNSHYGGADTAVFLDPPYRAYEAVYGAHGVADEVAAWAGENAHLRVALCGHVGDYDLPDWSVVQWSRGRHTYAGNKTTDLEAIWFSPACIQPDTRQRSLFDEPTGVSA